MSLAQRGAYIECLARQWLEGSIPDDVSRLSRMMGCIADDEREALAWVMQNKFKKDGRGRLKNRRLDSMRVEVHAKVETRKEVNRRNGSKGGRPPKTESETKAKPNGFTRAFGSGSGSDSSLPKGGAGGKRDGPDVGGVNREGYLSSLGVDLWAHLQSHGVRIPPEIEDDKLLAVLGEWLIERERDEGKPPSTGRVNRLMAKLKAWGVARSVEAIEHSITGGYKNIYEPKGSNNGGNDRASRVEAEAGKYAGSGERLEPER